MANLGCISQSHLLSQGNNGGREDMYTELWKACARRLVDIPRNGERVYYFPQGHMKQLMQFYKEVKDAFKDLFADEKVGSTSKSLSKSSHQSKGRDMSY